MRSLLIAALLCASSPAADAKCAMSGLAPIVLTPSGATISLDGGIVVGATDTDDYGPSPGEAAHQPGWRWKLGAQVATPALVAIAPGLVLYQLPAKAREAQLIDDKHAPVGKVIAGAKLATLPAPKLVKVAHTSTSGRRRSARITVELAGNAPDGAIALVLADEKGTPRSWGRPGAKRTLTAYDHSRCRVLPNGTVESMPGERVTAFWVDASGRRSPLSTSTTVAGTQPVEGD